MSKTKPELKVTWLTDEEATRTAAGGHFKQMTQGDGIVEFNPFVITEKQQTVDTGAARIKELWEAGKLTDEQALDAMRRAERVNRSMGRDILYDNRILAKNRVTRYVAWAITQGTTEEVARKFALSEILKQATSQGGFGGKNRGGVAVELDILKDL